MFVLCHAEERATIWSRRQRTLHYSLYVLIAIATVRVMHQLEEGCVSLVTFQASLDNLDGSTRRTRRVIASIAAQKNELVVLRRAHKVGSTMKSILANTRSRFISDGSI